MICLCDCRVNCSFYFKIGACRHGDRCSRIHNKPTFSQTVLLQNLYVNPQNSAKSADGSHCEYLAVLNDIYLLSKCYGLIVLKFYLCMIYTFSVLFSENIADMAFTHL